jgi:two-component system, LuxR family, response regulator FixJ
LTATIAIVDDDQAVRRSLVEVLRTYGFDTVEFSSGEEFLNKGHSHHLDCILLDVRMPGVDGLKVQKLLRQQHASTPIIFITGHGDIPLAVRAMREGAFDFIEKPVRDDLLTASIDSALKSGSRTWKDEVAAKVTRERIRQLTPREREVMQLVVEGHSSTAIGAILGISGRTADHHRARILEKIGATSVANLIRLVLSQDESGPQALD